MEDFNIGAIVCTEVEKKKVPFKTFFISLVVSVLIIWFSHSQSHEELYLVVPYWMVLSIYVLYKLYHKRTFKFGETGMIVEKYSWGTVNEINVINYDDLSEPKYHITDLKVNGSHTNYVFTVNFGAVSFAYNYNFKNKDKKCFDYIVAHKLYRLWKKHLTGAESDFDEDSIICGVELRDKVKKLLS